jgi:CRP-like cAMP-binding protein
MSDSNEIPTLLIEFLSSFPELDGQPIEEIARLIPVEVAQKGSVLVEEGKVPQACYFVLKGMVRQYKFVDGDEKTMEFYDESNGAVSAEHFTDQSKSTFFLVCEEDSLLIKGSREVDVSNYEKYPVLLEVTKKMLEQDLNETKSRFSKFISASPKERYLNFLQDRPGLINRVPLHQVASYLGMTPESLSRIRKRILQDG